MKFKEINAVFKVVEDKPLRKEKIKKGRLRSMVNWRIEVKRYVSGAFSYGDRSGHCFDIYDFEEKHIGNHSYDTRYDSISTEKEKWLKIWSDLIESDFAIKLELVSFEENIKEIQD